MKICDLTQFYSPVSGGVKRYVHEKVRYLEEQTGDSHLLIIPGERDERRAVGRSGRSVVCTIRSPLLSRTSGYRALLRLGAIDEIVKRERPDLIECGDPYQVAWKAVSSGRVAAIPVIGFYHSHFPEAYLRHAARLFGPAATERTLRAAQRYVKRLYGRFEKTLVPSPALAGVLQGWGVENTETVDLGVDTAIFRPPSEGGENAEGCDDRAATRAEFGFRADETVCLYVGRLAQEKNSATLFAAFERLHRETPGRYRLLIVGDGLQRSEVKALQAATGGLAGNSPGGSAVVWIPYCAEAGRLAAIYRCADLFVHPGVQETFGLVALESQACGTPVIGIRGSYMDRIIQTDQGDWARENTPEALAGAIRKSAGRGTLREEGAAASRAVRAQYDWERVFARLFEIYRSTIDAYKPCDV